MKKIILSLTGMVVALTIVFSTCQKEEIVNAENTSKPINENNIYTQKAKIVVGIKIV